MDIATVGAPTAMPRFHRPTLPVPALALLAALATGAMGGALAQSPADQSRRQVPRPADRPLSAAEAATLLGKNVHTRDGEPAGTIRDFTLAGPGGAVDDAILASGGLLGLGATLVMVPADRLRVGATASVPKPGGAPPVNVTLDLTAAELAAAPSFAYDPSVRTLSGSP